ncbi:hypothetical protein ACIBFB_09595 [Nocardiopsis sp. NPDC050513]|uniref:hypothetical protein n=1 Tax=Nocardiopsis sp. NPDC050513 TaxID=3364338 RepID=UPI0037BDA19B
MTARTTRPGRRRAVTVLAALTAAGFVLFALVRVLGLERGFPLVPLLAYAPLVLFAAPVALLGAALLRRWWSAAAIALAGVLLATAILPRAFAGGPVAVEGPPLRLLTLNVHFGHADPDAAGPVEVVSVHPMSPRRPSTVAAWRDGLRGLPEAAIDHVLVDERVAVVELEILDVAGTTHRALLTGLILPGGPA